MASFKETCEQKVKVIRKLDAMAKNNSDYDSIRKDVIKLLYFMEMLPETAKGACTLAVMGGEDGLRSNDGVVYKDGAASDKFNEKYINGGLELREIYGEDEYINQYREYFENNVKPARSLLGVHNTSNVDKK